MDDFDKADLDGDGEFDAIDLSILEEEHNKNGTSGKPKLGCCVPALITVTLLGSGCFLITRYLT